MDGHANPSDKTTKVSVGGFPYETKPGEPSLVVYMHEQESKDSSSGSFEALRSLGAGILLDVGAAIEVREGRLARLMASLRTESKEIDTDDLRKTFVNCSATRTYPALCSQMDRCWTYAKIFRDVPAPRGVESCCQSPTVIFGPKAPHALPCG